MPSPFAERVVEDMQEITEQGLSPEQFTDVSRTVARDCRRLASADVRVLVIGNYDDARGQKTRVLRTRDELSTRRTDAEAFLLEDVDPADEAWENWYVKFRIFERRATHVVGVFEDNDGGHELEAGEVDTSKLWILKRDYYADDGSVDEAREYDRFDGMLVKLFEFLEARGRCYRWSTAADGDDLDAAIGRLLANVGPDDEEAPAAESTDAGSDTRRDTPTQTPTDGDR